MAATDLTTPETVAARVGGVPASDVAGAVAAASAAVVTAIGAGALHYAPAHVERLEGHGRPRLVLSRRPVASVGAVEVSNGDGTWTPLPAAEIEIEDGEAGILFRLAGFPSTALARRSVTLDRDLGLQGCLLRVTYAGGWVTPGQAAGPEWAGPARDFPADLEEAVIQTSASIYLSNPDRNVSSERIGAASIAFFGANTAVGRKGHTIPDSALALINPYVRRV